MRRAITTVIRRGSAAWQARYCRIRWPASGPAGCLARGLPAAGSVRLAPVQLVHPSWAQVPLGCNCRYLAGAAGWVMETCLLNCPELPAHRVRS
jgi:hypothetical protein